MKPKQAFFAYPDNRHIGPVILQATNQLDRSSNLYVTPWQKLNIVGFRIDDLIRERLQTADVLFADITFANFNVYYEIGFALALNKTVVPTLNSSIDPGVRENRMIGAFDTVGYLPYDNSDQLAEKLLREEYPTWTETFVEKQNHNQPLFFLDCLKKTDFRNQLRQAIDLSSIQIRSFDPSELPRLSSPSAIRFISASSGAIIPLLDEAIVDGRQHNLRAAFLAGLAHGFNIEPLIIQWERNPVPLDFADYVTNVNRVTELTGKVHDYCAATLVNNQKRPGFSSKANTGILQNIDIGSSAAENESSALADYFVETAEFQRALRSNSSIVVGRKGTGKSAICNMVSQKKGAKRSNLLIELNPASHNLSKLRQSLLSVFDHGVFDHTIAAFWQYILYAEVLMAARNALLPKAKYNSQMQDFVREIETALKLTDTTAGGDFTSRLAEAVDSIVKYIARTSDSISPQQLTNILHERDLRRLRDLSRRCRSHFEELVLLFDNIDKGWPAKGVEPDDVRIIRLLIEALDKMQKELGITTAEFVYSVFLRSDVFELLVRETSDRGKYNLIAVDWTDPLQLRHLVERRLDRLSDARYDSEGIWKLVVPNSSDGTSMFQEMLDHCLMRPRFLIDLCERAISIAINRGHQRVEQADMGEALKQHSLYLVKDFIFEIHDVSPVAEDLFYRFIGKGELFTKKELLGILGESDTTVGSARTLDLLLWFGFIGIARSDKDHLFIYSVNYDQARLEALARLAGDELLYCINPAFLTGLAV